jgi:hypothetical protein
VGFSWFPSSAWEPEARQGGAFPSGAWEPGKGPAPPSSPRSCVGILRDHGITVPVTVTKRNLRNDGYLLRRESSMLRRAGQVRAEAYPTGLVSGSQSVGTSRSGGNARRASVGRRGGRPAGAPSRPDGPPSGCSPYGESWTLPRPSSRPSPQAAKRRRTPERPGHCVPTQERRDEQGELGFAVVGPRRDLVVRDRMGVPLWFPHVWQDSHFGGGSQADLRHGVRVISHGCAAAA